MSGSNERVLRLARLCGRRLVACVPALCVAGLFTFSLTTAAQAPPKQTPPKEVQTKQSDTESVEGLVGVSSELSRLKEIAGGGVHPDRWEILWLHQHISERIMAASLQVDATIAQIDNEIATADEVHDYLADRRDSTVNRANLLGILLGGGLSATSSALQLSTNLNKSTTAIDLAGGSASVGFALVGIYAQKGGSSRFDFNSNMLAEFFDRPVLSNSQYPVTVWAFLNEVSPNSPEHLTRRAQLLTTWVVVQRLGSLSNTDKIARVTSQPSEMLKLNIDDLEDRAAMLQDVRARISYLKRDLGNLLASLPEVDESALLPVGEKQ
jgi:hypothetical protein